MDDTELGLRLETLYRMARTLSLQSENLEREIRNLRKTFHLTKSQMVLDLDGKEDDAKV